MASEAAVAAAMDKYADMIQRICFIQLKNVQDTEDVFQEVFLKYFLRTEPFQSDAHEKAWLIRVAINTSKDNLKNFFKRNVIPLEQLVAEPATLPQENQEILTAMTRLPKNYRQVIYLFYIEGYSAVEIADILKKKSNTIYTWLARGREQLQKELGADYFEG
ncbi:RNA polymerase sigma factor (sigma-70 family) [Enterococcus sp. PF1-24]|uniref:RNA polymerase sigma factor n=1 Tax=unclassified Enterococcus TaxID=2608891 RepID=UPI00247604D4|nr:MULTISPECIES: sigma-70 family RNA polymerase sigma factor [unclassified Enterococcus]MDH6363433.1 RNA polymerase sigma factor (sigma-70 family) [Enterococcus sp. PFB1-1]MDH6400527.1 RNA polymerase sigma factor (sigma-70 family) [Enterococcus sp. PF1-24]